MMYKDIVVQIHDKYGIYIPEQRIRRWLMTGGILRDKYEEYAREQNEDRRTQLRQKFEYLGSRAPEVIEQTLFEVRRHPMTGMPFKDEEGNVMYVRNSNTTEALKVLITILGIKPGDEGEVVDNMAKYFKRLEEAPIPRLNQAVELKEPQKT